MKTIFTLILFLFLCLPICAQKSNKAKFERDSIALTQKAMQYKLYNNLYNAEIEKYNKVNDTTVNKAYLKIISDYKNRRDTIYYNAMLLKSESIAENVAKDKLDKIFPDDVADLVKEKEEKKEELNKFMYLNAIDFDFADSKAGYVGHLNLYSPCVNRWGFAWNAGILKINYSTKDSIVEYKQENVLLNPLDELSVGDSYIRQYNSYKYKTKNTGYSIYFQPMLKITGKNRKIMIFAHFHSELLVSRITNSVSVNTIAQDTVTIQNDNQLTMRPLPTKYQIYNSVYSQNYLSGNFGFGVTLDLHFTDKSSLFLQPTLGYTTNYPNISSVNSLAYRYEDLRDNNWFYLVRSYYRHTLSDGTDLILGTDIRGLFPQYDPFYSMYVGLNLSVEKVVEILK